MFIPYRSKGPSLQVESLWKKKASTVFNSGGIVFPDGAGNVQPATVAADQLIGVNFRNITAADPDYAQNTPLFVIIPDQHAEFIADVGNGVATPAMVGLQFDLFNADSIDVTASMHKVVTITQFISATKVIVKLNSSLFTQFGT